MIFWKFVVAAVRFRRRLALALAATLAGVRLARQVIALQAPARLPVLLAPLNLLASIAGAAQALRRGLRLLRADTLRGAA